MKFGNATISPDATGLIILAILGSLAGIMATFGQWEIVKAILAMMSGQLLATPYRVRSGESAPAEIMIADDHGGRHD